MDLNLQVKSSFYNLFIASFVEKFPMEPKFLSYFLFFLQAIFYNF